MAGIARAGLNSFTFAEILKLLSDYGHHI